MKQKHFQSNEKILSFSKCSEKQKKNIYKKYNKYIFKGQTNLLWPSKYDDQTSFYTVVIDIISIIIFEWVSMKYDVIKSYSCYYWCFVVVADVSAEIIIQYVAIGVVDVQYVLFNGILSLKVIINDMYWVWFGFDRILLKMDCN